MALANDIELEFVWKPRSTDVMVHADALSRTEDSSGIVLSHKVFMQLVQRWGMPTLDVFADAAGESTR